jgi:endonuclease/exonuclease/phosphatase family metal-dependent hydrolase
MRSLRVTTWNVLHRVHAVNWKEPPIAAFPDERVRIDGVATLVASWLAGAVDVVCLQEASGDQLARLRSVVRAPVRFFEHTYPRVPRVRASGQRADLDDPTEHLVVLANAPDAKAAYARTFETDDGKGLLAVDLGDDLTVIDTHVSFGPRRDAQLAVLSELARRSPRGAVILGDFNAPADVVAAGFGESAVSISDLAGSSRPTRIATGEQGGRTIDHVVVVGGSLASATVLDGNGLSDHNPVNATVEFRA